MAIVEFESPDGDEKYWNREDWDVDEVIFTGEGGYPTEPTDAIEAGLVVGQTYAVDVVVVHSFSSYYPFYS